MRVLANARRPNRWHGVAVAVAVLAIGLLALGDALQVGPVMEPAPSLVPTAGPTKAAGTPDAWAPLELAPLETVATLEPSSVDDAGIAPDATFALASLTDEPADRLAERLEITPTTPFAVRPGATADTVSLTPRTPMVAGTTYRFVLRGAEGATAGSWAYRVRGPVRVLTTVPGDATVGVPVRTGVEVTFDQEGVADMEDAFTIEPPVAGTFERHGRTQVFVPDALAPRTLYTVTLANGLARAGTDLTLEADVVFRFETEGPEDEEARLIFSREAIEVAPGEAPTIAVRAIRPWLGDDRAAAPSRAHLRVYRFGSIDAASRALGRFVDAPRWTTFAEPRVPTDGLELVSSIVVPLDPFRDDTFLLHYPDALAPGVYLVELQGDRPAQAFLQVTPVSAWVSVMTDRTVVWVNDVVTHGPIGRVRVDLEGGPTIATSDADGLAIGPTPRGLQSPIDPAIRSGSPILRVTAPTGDVVLVPFNVAGDDAYRGEWWESSGSANEEYWALLYTDRGLYRRTDRIEAWGYLRLRDADAVPGLVTIRLVTAGSGSETPQVASVDVSPSADGAFTASLAIAGLPTEPYELQALVDGRVVASRWLSVSVIRKPPYQLELVPDRRAVIAGQAVTWTATATFFDGTPVPNLELVINDDATSTESRVATDAGGRASVTSRPRFAGTSAWSSWWVQARPAGPESGEIYASATVVVFPSAEYLDVDAVVDGRRLRVGGTVTRIDFPDLEGQLAGGRDWKPTGPVVADRTIQITVTELVPTRTQIGSEYDFVEKVVRPVYSYDTRPRTLGTTAVVSAADGSIELTTLVPDGDHEYELTLSSMDDDRREQVRMAWVRTPASVLEEAGVVFVPTNDKQGPYRIGQTIDWRMVDDGRTLPSGGADRYLYLVARLGLRSAVVSDTPRFRRVFREADVPGVFVIGVRFTGTTYAPKAATWANFDQAEREIRVEVVAGRAGYRPGETATITVRTTEPGGAPIPATVVLQAVDEKLYAMGDASPPRPLEDLYDRVDSGIVRLTATHQVPSMSGPEGEGGDTAGGGDTRSDFRDTLFFRELRTDRTGLATVAVRLSDDLTSWHLTASAVTADLKAGSGELLVPVGLPFFVELTVADTYLVTDRPVVQARAFGSALTAGDAVEFTVASKSLRLAATTVRGTAFEPVGIALPELQVGRQAVTASAVAPGRQDPGGLPLRDALTLPFDVVRSRLTATEAAYSTLDTGLPALPAATDRTVWSFTDAGRGRLIPVLDPLVVTGSLRIDRRIAQQVAMDLLVDGFGRDREDLPPTDFDPSAYPIRRYTDEESNPTRAGVALLPYGDVDPWLAARIAVLAPNAVPYDSLRDTLLAIHDVSSTRRDLAIAVTAGLAALGAPVLGDLQVAAREPDLSVTERLYLALGFEAAGDDSSATAIERALLAEHGERLGAWVRLRADRTDDGSDATALLAVIAAGLGDPLADGLAAYAVAFPAEDASNALELAAYAVRSFDRTPSAAASFAYTVAGRRTVVDLQPGDTFWLALTAAQGETLEAESLSGRVGAAVEARVPVDPGSLVPHPDLTLTRAVPSQPMPADHLVQVDLVATFASTAPEGCYDVRELVPSGLAPLDVGWVATDEQGITWPSSVVGQEVRFCAANGTNTRHRPHLRYLARVVSEGTFAWEPAVMQLPAAPELLAVTAATTATIAGD